MFEPIPDCLTQREQDEIENSGKARGGSGYSKMADKLQESLWDQKIWCDVIRTDDGVALIARDFEALSAAKDEMAKQGITITSSRLA
jgi:hypothetical protein